MAVRIHRNFGMLQDATNGQKTGARVHTLCWAGERSNGRGAPLTLFTKINLHVFFAQLFNVLFNNKISVYGSILQSSGKVSVKPPLWQWRACGLIWRDAGSIIAALNNSLNMRTSLKTSLQTSQCKQFATGKDSIYSRFA